MDLAEKLLNLPATQLKRRSKRKKRAVRVYKRLPRPSYCRDELIAFARKHKIHSRYHLTKIREEGDPTFWDYIKEFGSWTEAKTHFSIDKVKYDRKYIIKLVIEFDLWNVKRYNFAYNSNKDIMPSLGVVIKEFGSWTALKHLAAIFSLKRTIALYVNLKKKLKRVPTKEDCFIESLELEPAMKVFGTKNCFDKFICSLEEISE